MNLRKGDQYSTPKIVTDLWVDPLHRKIFWSANKFGPEERASVSYDKAAYSCRFLSDNLKRYSSGSVSRRRLAHTSRILAFLRTGFSHRIGCLLPPAWIKILTEGVGSLCSFNSQVTGAERPPLLGPKCQPRISIRTETVELRLGGHVLLAYRLE